MLNRLPFPSGDRIPLHAALGILLISFSQCQKKDESPPPPKIAHDFANGKISEGLLRTTRELRMPSDKR